MKFASPNKKRKIIFIIVLIFFLSPIPINLFLFQIYHSYNPALLLNEFVIADVI